MLRSKGSTWFGRLTGQGRGRLSRYKGLGAERVKVRSRGRQSTPVASSLSRRAVNALAWSFNPRTNLFASCMMRPCRADCGISSLPSGSLWIDQIQHLRCTADRSNIRLCDLLLEYDLLARRGSVHRARRRLVVLVSRSGCKRAAHSKQGPRRRIPLLQNLRDGHA